MKRIRGILTATLAAMVMLTVASATAAQAKKTTSSSNKTVMQQVSSATSGFFKGVVDTVTLKKFTSKSSKSTKK